MKQSLLLIGLFLLLALSQSRGAAINSTSTGGSWGATTTWVGNVVPSSIDAVTIVNSSTVTIDGVGTTTPSCASLTVGQGSASTLQFTSASGFSACALTVS